ncbi:MAG: Nif3-like dinuclear metal center hexameric protein [Clostridia bacterium]|nr:Nif3-like dinuclear metal center hexameric protein [Clostridia bacterium]
MILKNIAELIEKMAPKELACEWDNVGIMLGDENAEIKTVVVSLDFNTEVLEFAKSKNADLIVTHHPAIFNKLSSVTDTDFLDCIRNNINVYSAHTNFDTAEGGVNDALCKALGLSEVKANGMLRYGKVNEMTALEFAEYVKEKLDTKGVRICGDPDKKISTVGVLGGSGGDELNLALEVGCDVYLTGEAAYHDAQTAQKNGIVLIAAGHYETEIFMVEAIDSYLKENTDLTVYPFIETNIYKVI